MDAKFTHKMDSEVTDPFPIREFFLLLFKNWPLHAVLVAISVGLGAAYYRFKPAYPARGTLLIQNEKNSPFQEISARLAGIRSGSSAKEEHLEKYLLYLSSHDFYLHVAREFKSHWADPKKREALNVSEKAAMDYFKDDILAPEALQQEVGPDVMEEKSAERLLLSVRASKNGPDSIGVRIVTPDPNLSVALVNLTLNVAVQRITTSEIKELDEAKNYVHTQLESTAREVQGTDLAIVNFKSKNQIFSLDPYQTEVAMAAVELRARVKEQEMLFEQNQRVISSLSSKLTPEQRNSASKDGSGTAYKHSTQAQLDSLEKENELVSIRLETLRKSLSELITSKQKLPREQQQIVDVRRRAELQYAIFKELRSQLSQIEIQRISVLNKVRVFELARLANVTRSQRLSSLLFFVAMLALALGAGLVYLRDVLTLKIRTKRDIDQFKLAWLGNVPTFSRRKNPLLFSESANSFAQVCQFDLDTSESMSFRQIRTEILQSLASLSAGIPGKAKVLGIFGAQQGDGKTFTSTNIAASFASMGKKTLLIDADLRKADVSRTFELRGHQGFAEVLAGTQILSKVLVRELLPHLDVLASGKDQKLSAEAMFGEALPKLLAELRAQYDFIIVDTPPLLEVADSVAISHLCDFHIFCASSGRTSRDNLMTSLERFSRLRPSQIHCILNRTDRKLPSYGYGYGQGVTNNFSQPTVKPTLSQ